MTRENEQALVQDFLAALRAGADFRDRKVRRLRAAIRAGAFENQLKMEIATDRLASDLLETEETVAATPDARVTNEG